ncbi:MFS transporter [Yinghuangia soli]|uniref:MFS transporter n=1 Tax=Yinghuangia soli TaxID=2908204 RepID=A0AA41PUE3_9ACTN|nr:MFS transporter [Yinghuangia soli]MCF2526058.1 MFS transporter [Yinghuangia soli]
MTSSSPVPAAASGADPAVRSNSGSSADALTNSPSDSPIGSAPGVAASASRSRGTWLILVLACACQFMVILDASIVNVALPSVRSELGFTATGLAWVVNGYLLSFAGFMLVGGRAADLFGHRRMLVAGLAVFSAASLAGGLADTPGLLVGARIVQGVGAAVMAPATLAVLNTAFGEGPERARAFGAWAAAGGVGGMAGALAGGALTTGLSWRWVFLINVPIGAVLIAVALAALSGARPARTSSLDLLGASTGTAGLAALICGVMQGTDHGWTSAYVLAPIAAGLLLLVGFLAVEARFAARPMLPLRLFGLRGVAVGNVMLLLFGGIAIAMWYFTSLFLQNVLGYSALRAGLGQTPAAVAFMLVAGRSAALLPRTGVRPLVLSGAACFVAGFGWLSFADAGSSYFADILGPTLLIAAGIGLTFPTLMAVATAEVPDGDAGTAGGLANTASQVGSSLGLAALATAAAARADRESLADTPSALALGYDLVFLVAAALALAIAAASLLLPGKTGD